MTLKDNKPKPNLSFYLIKELSNSISELSYSISELSNSIRLTPKLQRNIPYAF